MSPWLHSWSVCEFHGMAFTVQVAWSPGRGATGQLCLPLLSAAWLLLRQDNNPVVKVPSIQDGEQLYAVCTILPFANMQELDLSGLQLSSAQWCALLESVSRCSGLRVLSIKGCGLGALGASVGASRCCRTHHTAAAAAAAGLVITHVVC